MQAITPINQKTRFWVSHVFGRLEHRKTQTSCNNWREAFKVPRKAGSITESASPKQWRVRQQKLQIRKLSQGKATHLCLPFTHISISFGSGSPVHNYACLDRQNNTHWRGSCYSAATKTKRQLSMFPFPLYLLLLNCLYQIRLRQQTHKTKYFASGTGNLAPAGGYFQHDFTWRVKSSTLKGWTSTLITKL